MSTTACNRRALFSGVPVRRLADELRPRGRTAELTAARRAMACEFSITIPGWVRGAAEAAYAALDEVDRLEDKLSAYREGSSLSYINRHAFETPVVADGELFELLRRAIRLSEDTGGAFDAATGALVKAWGFFRGPRRLPSDEERRAALAASGSRLVSIDLSTRQVGLIRRGVELNFGGIGKGYAIDRSLDLVRREHQVRCALMQGGQSSLRGVGSPTGQPRGWAVDIGSPENPRRAVARVWLQDQALGTSGAANQFFEVNGRRYGHVLDPRTGWPAQGVLGASAITRSATDADALSTAFFVLGPEGTREFVRKHPGVTAVMVLPGKAGLKVEVIGDADVEVLQ